MNADGTYPVTRTGESITELDVLPEGSVVSIRLGDDLAVGWRCADGWHLTEEDVAYSGSEIDPDATLTVLFRPDAPQPATGDAVERAARAMQIENRPKPDPLNRDQREEQDDATIDAYRALARAALAAARAGEAEGYIVQEMAEAIDDATLSHLSPAENLERQANAAARVAAQHGGEAVDREALLVAVGGVLFNAMNYPEPVQARILGQDTRPLTEKVVNAILAARGDAAPTEVEWGVQAKGLLDGHGDDIERQGDEAEARERLAEMLDPAASEHGVGYPDAHLVQRTVSAWREVQP